MRTAHRLLLDTHVVLWWLTDDPTLPKEIKRSINEDVDVFVSAATVWEVAIKQGCGKLTAPVDLAQKIRDSDLPHIPITSIHATTAGRLPLLHRDPFDRMLVAQSRLEGLTLVTRDETLKHYDIDVLPA